jgi:hypothetical protein
MKVYANIILGILDFLEIVISLMMVYLEPKHAGEYTI